MKEYIYTEHELKVFAGSVMLMAICGNDYQAAEALHDQVAKCVDQLTTEQLERMYLTIKKIEI